MGKQSGANDWHVFDCKCGISKRCPDLRRDGDGILITDDDDALVALEAPRKGIRLSAKAASEIREKLEAWGY